MSNVYNNILINFLKLMLTKLENNTIKDCEIEILREMYYKHTINDTNNCIDMKYYTMGWYIYNFILSN